ncbi:MAG: hypothetical protein KUG78_19290 [Kangiellaceae bacterium]|nr:hypothetical protein [Kangiellaceae bacterium]
MINALLKCNLTDAGISIIKFSQRIARRLIKLFILFLVSELHAITVDGKPDDIEWRQQKSENTFFTVAPFTRNAPDYLTEVQSFSDSHGIYFLITNHQQKTTQYSQRSARDAHMNADYNNIVIDFNNDGLSAYSFTIANGGSIEDGTYQNENSYNYEWNGVWFAKTSSDEKHWYVEVHIPWDIAPMVDVNSEQRNIGLYISRRVAHQSKTYANSPIHYSRQRFLSELPILTINDYAKSSLQVFGFGSSRNDRVANETIYDAGLDLFWKPKNNQQLSITVNPDFGQIESDQLVVNFSPTETFFSENRPFFTENQTLFDLNGTNSLRLIHTRRIGSNPDTGEDLGSDLLGALKFTSVGQDFNYGIFSAIEDEGTDSEGRNYYVGRVISQNHNYNIGYLVTHTDRPDIDRNATVQALDYDYKINQDLTISSHLIYSDISERNQLQRDHAVTVKAQHQLSNNWQHTIKLNHFGDDFEVNDLGFLPRNNFTSFGYSNRWQDNKFELESSIKEHKFNLEFDHQENNAGVHLVSSFNLSDTWYWKDSSSLMTGLTLNSNAHDDLITRGNNILATKDGYQFELLYHAASRGQSSFHAHSAIFDQAIKGNGFSAHAHGTYYFTDHYSLNIGVWFYDSENWMLWQQANQLNSYKKKQLTTRINFNATIDEQQELIFKVEWLALSASGQQAFQVTQPGELYELSQSVANFSVSDTSMQVRYRYELSPLSNIYIVYSRGGRSNLEEDVSLSNLFSPGWQARDGDNFLVKVRYQF